MRIRTELEEWWLDFELDMQDVTQVSLSCFPSPWAPVL